jgi:hypothetical protein
MNAQRTKLTAPPAEIELIYQQRGDSHVFIATGFAGFYYSSTMLKTSFDEVAHALGLHISELCGKPASYRLPMTFEEFRDCLKDSNDEDDTDIAELVRRNSIIAQVAPGECGVSR